MANQEQGEVPFEVNGRTFTLVLNTKAIATIETYLAQTEGRTVTWEQFWPRVLSRSVAAVGILVWGTMRRHHPEMTLDATFGLIDEAGGVGFVRALVDGLQSNAQPDPEDVKELVLNGSGKPKKAKRPPPAQPGARLNSPRSTRG